MDVSIIHAESKPFSLQRGLRNFPLSEEASFCRGSKSQLVPGPAYDHLTIYGVIRNSKNAVSI